MNTIPSEIFGIIASYISYEQTLDLEKLFPKYFEDESFWISYFNNIGIKMIPRPTVKEYYMSSLMNYMYNEKLPDFSDFNSYIKDRLDDLDNGIMYIEHRIIHKLRNVGNLEIQYIFRQMIIMNQLKNWVYDLILWKTDIKDTYNIGISGLSEKKYNLIKDNNLFKDIKIQNFNSNLSMFDTKDTRVIFKTITLNKDQMEKLIIMMFQAS